MSSYESTAEPIKLGYLFDFKLPPEKVVKKGGYKSVDEGVSDMTNKIREVWNKRHHFVYVNDFYGPICHDVLPSLMSLTRFGW